MASRVRTLSAMGPTGSARSTRTGLTSARSPSTAPARRGRGWAGGGFRRCELTLFLAASRDEIELARADPVTGGAPELYLDRLPVVGVAELDRPAVLVE